MLQEAAAKSAHVQGAVCKAETHALSLFLLQDELLRKRVAFSITDRKMVWLWSRWQDLYE